MAANTYAANAVELAGGTFVGGSVTLPMAGSFAAISTLGPNNIVRDSTLTAAEPLKVTDDNMTASGLRITGGEQQAVSVMAVGITLADSTIVKQGQGFAVYVSTGDNVDAAITLDHDTIVGDDTADSDGVYADGFDLNTNSATITLRNSIIRGFTHSLGRASRVGGGTSDVTTSYSDYPPTTETDFGGGGPGGYNQGIGNIDADPGFLNASGDYRLPAGSPAIDVGDPAGLLGNEPKRGPGRPAARRGRQRRLRRAHRHGGVRVPGGCALRTAAAGCGHDRARPLAPERVAVAVQARARRNKPVGTRGTVLSFTLTEAATVKLAIVRRSTGHRSAGKCRTHGRGPRCTTTKTLITLTAHGQTGVNHYAFRGRVRSRALAPGSYEVVATAVDAAGNRTANAVKLRFRVIR